MADEVLELEEGHESPEQKKNKLEKKYQSAMNTLKQIIGGEKNLLPAKAVEGDTLAGIVADLFKEEDEAIAVKVKEGLKGLLKTHAGAMKDIRSKEQELEKLKNQKKEEFVKAANQFFNMIDRSFVATKEYASLLEEAFAGDEKKEPATSTDTTVDRVPGSSESLQS